MTIYERKRTRKGNRKVAREYEGSNRASKWQSAKPSSIFGVQARPVVTAFVSGFWEVERVTAGIMGSI